jgi:hypothetical protein
MDRPRAAKLIRMLSSPSDGEVLSAARALCRMGIYDVAERVANGSNFETGSPLHSPAMDSVDQNTEWKLTDAMIDNCDEE